MKSPSNPVKCAGASAGIVFNDERLILDTLPSHCFVEHAHQQGKGEAAIEELFQAYFERAEDISEPAVLQGLCDKLQIDDHAPAWTDENLQQHVRSEAKEWRTRYNVTEIPFFVLRKHDSDVQVRLTGTKSPEAFIEIFREHMD
eukprot:gnl/MRDRNA2_/MRDRNA2_43819_c0_seq1.p1 gnl/MRDRNA2_/MRDRNA2_43819_c0~~gnl/MRDRNA2_/MRDRNA2_43819_c0_seq1.p1  ORF type:complete len:144 (+),score=36.80 gnl/MRDRNA2_/MRDRNA2_43819_c0_seq1:300-731(+)